MGVGSSAGGLDAMAALLRALPANTGMGFVFVPHLHPGHASQLAETTMDPRHRMLRRIRVEDAAAASSMFDLLMGSEVAPRREFIVSGAAELDATRIDI